MYVVLWGTADHATPADVDDLDARLRSLGHEVARAAFPGEPPHDAEAIVVHSKVRVDAAALAAMPRVRTVLTTTSGVEHVDLAAAAARGVAVLRCPLARRDAVVDASLALGLALVRQVPRLQRHAREGDWTRRRVKELPVPLVAGLDVGVFGNGVIGRRAAAAWTALGARVRIADPAYPSLPEKDDVLRRSRLVTLHCSLSETSRRLLDARALALLPRGAIVINTARGECIDLDALLAAADAGHVAGMGLDVFEPEPFPRLAELAARDDTLLTPHSAGWHEGLARAVNDEVEAIVRGLEPGGR